MSSNLRARGRIAALLVACGLAAVAGCHPVPASGGHAEPGVLLVCNGSTKACPKVPHYRTVQSAVDATRPGDWVLIWPGVYHENNAAHHAGVWITTPRLHIRGLDRNSVIIDGSDGPASHPCPSSPNLQNLTPRDGIVVWKASGVTIENLTVCDYLAGPGAVHGTQIWWTGGSGQGAGTASASTLGLGTFSGSYLTATSMYHPADIKSQHLAEFGIFVGDATGPGLITSSYASNMANAAFYVGACQRSCNTTLADDRGTNSAIGYLGTNSGGRLKIQSSVFDDNRSGMVLLSLNTDDLPPPQDGRCPGSATTSCTVIERNSISHNDNANAPAFGINPAVGLGIEISGGQFDTVADNVIADNGSWGLLINDSLDALSHLPQSHCQGGTPNTLTQNTCLFAARANRVYGNTFQHDGTFGNATNSDIAMFSLAPVPPIPRNCFFANHAIGGPITSSPRQIQAISEDGQPCDRPGTGADKALLEQLSCADGERCTAPANYPSQTAVDSVAVPREPTMPNPCASIPSNGFC